LGVISGKADPAAHLERISGQGMCRPDFGQRLVDDRDCVAPATLPVRDVDAFEAQPACCRASVSEPLGDWEASANSGGGLVELADAHVVCEQVVVAAEALGRANLVRDLDALLEVADPVDVTSVDAGAADVVECVRAHLVQPQL
jgi:hypothetical protein